MTFLSLYLPDLRVHPSETTSLLLNSPWQGNLWPSSRTVFIGVSWLFLSVIPCSPHRCGIFKSFHWKCSLHGHWIVEVWQHFFFFFLLLLLFKKKKKKKKVSIGPKMHNPLENILNVRSICKHSYLNSWFYSIYHANMHCIDCVACRVMDHLLKIQCLILQNPNSQIHTDQSNAMSDQN